jgi:phosphate transport system substrate-binding protein
MRPFTRPTHVVDQALTHARARRKDTGPDSNDDEEGGQGSMKKRLVGRGTVVAVVAGLTLSITAAAAFAGAQALRGKITADGSSTVGPYVIAAAEKFQRLNRGVNITVGISGTGGGFERFCKGETDLADASRPMKQSEAGVCRSNGIGYEAFLVANDGISIVVNKRNTWVNCLTTDELKRIWNTYSNVDSWSKVRGGFPNVPLKLFGPGTDSGTFDFFTERINGRAKASRSDYTASEDDNVLVRGVEGERGGLGYFGYSYYLENRDKLKLVAVNSGNGCVSPSIRTVQAYSYKPLSRPLFVYAKRTSFDRAAVQAFIRYMITNEKGIATTAGFVSLTDRQLAKAKYQYNRALRLARG